MFYCEIRVRPVVRYIITDFVMNDDHSVQRSTSFGEFDNANLANWTAESIQRRLEGEGGDSIVLEPARQLKISWLRGPGEPKEAIRWELLEPDASPG